MNLFYLLHSRCIKWAQEAFPAGGDSSGLVVIYEQCVRTFWHSERYKDDLRYLVVRLEYVSLFFSSNISLLWIFLCLTMNIFFCGLKTVLMQKSFSVS